MKNINVGIANLFIVNKLRNFYFEKDLIDESKNLSSDFFNTIKNSPILQLEFNVFDNIENKFIENDIVASRYIDNNIKLFEIYTIQEIEKEHEKLKQFISEDVSLLNNDKLTLYNAIDNLIKQSLLSHKNINVDKIHESFVIVLNHIKEPKNNMISENEEIELINDDILEIAVDKFNEKYESLNEDDKDLFQKLIKSNDEEKEELLESYKSENLSILESINKDTVKDNVMKAIQKIKEMKYNKSTVDNDIISLHELKKELL